jgi:predicted nuclease of predicted toxin-antitoxin system
VKVIVDAQLPKRLSDFLVTKQVDTRHTLELPGKNATPDQEIIRLADKEKRIVITKDSDFIDNYIFKGQPAKLLIVSTGNIDNTHLIDLFEKNIDTLISLFEQHSVIEINEIEISVHY